GAQSHGSRGGRVVAAGRGGAVGGAVVHGGDLVGRAGAGHGKDGLDGTGVALDDGHVADAHAGDRVRDQEETVLHTLERARADDLAAVVDVRGRGEHPAARRVDLRIEVGERAVVPEVVAADHLAEVVDGAGAAHAEVGRDPVLP